MSSKIKECPACTKDVAKSAKICPHCGKKLKTGLFVKLLAAIIVIGVIGAIFGPSKEEKAKKFAATLDVIAKATPANISPTGDLARIFKLNSEHTDLQRKKTEQEITGKIVQWTLPVYEVREHGNGYRIHTSGKQAIMGGIPMVGTFVNIYPRSEKERSFIEHLKTGNMITFKGKITGTSMRYIDISPAILMSK